MQEVTVELLTDLAPEVNTTNLLLDRVARGAQRPLFSVQRDGTWHDLSAGDFLIDVKRLAMVLINDGLQPGDKVAIISRTRYEWALAEEAVWFAGGVSVPIYETSSAFQVEWILRDSGARVVFAENHELRATVRQAAAQLGEPVRTHIFEGSDADDTTLIPSAGLHQLMVPADQIDEQLIESRRASMALKDVATMVYTSGTTGRPKGGNMTHSNFAMVAHNLAGNMLEVLGEERRTLMFLPLAHVLARAVQQTCIHGGSVIAHSSSMANLVEDMSAVKPGFLLAVPRVFEKIRTSALATAERGGKADLFLKAEQAAKAG